MTNYANTVSDGIASKVAICAIGSHEKHQNQVSNALMSFYQVYTFWDGMEAVDVLAQKPPAVILVDERAGASGVDVLAKIGQTNTLSHVPVICTASNDSLPFIKAVQKHNANGLLMKPYRRSDLLKIISSHLNKSVEKSWDNIEPIQQSALKKTVDTFNHISDLIDEGGQLPYGEVKDSCAPLVQAVSDGCFKEILKGVRGHDNYSYVHSLRVATFLSLFGHTIGIRGDDLMTLSTGGLMHDIGKMSIPHEVLNKPGKLDGEEWSMMKSHVPRTMECLLTNTTIPKGVLTIAQQHHEKLNGEGYPNGTKGDELNQLARMASIVDIFSALTDRRVYKEPMLPEKALTIMTEMTDELDQGLLGLFRTMLLDAATEA